MNWKVKEEKKQPVVGTERIKTIFCLFPKCIDGQWYWLTIIKVLQRWECVGVFDGLEGGGYWNGWKNIKVID